MISICKALAFLSVGIAISTAQSLPSAWTTGIATNYGGAQDGMDPSSPSFGTLDGSCGYGLLSTTVYPYWSVGALSTSNSFAIAGPSSGCGQCFEVKCMNSGGQFAGRCSSAQSVTITITDSCPECEANHLDLQALTFNKIAPMAIGRIDVQYRRVDCTPPLPVSIAIDNNVGVGGWLRLVVEKTAGFGGITAVAIRGGGGSWSPMNNKFGSAWETSNTPGLPWDFQFTSDAGQTITAMSLVSSGGVIGSIPTGVQFSLSGSTGQQAVSYDSAATSTAAATPATAATAASPPATGGATATPPTTTTPASNQAGGCPCADVQPTASITCAQQQAYGKCQDSWMTQGNFCQLTCGACPAACSASSGTATTPATPAAAATPPATTTPAAGTTPPATGTTPPAATTTPPTANPSAPAQAGSVQTQSIGASPPATTSTAAVSSAAATTCTDKAPASGTCAALVANNGCYKSDVLPQGTCDKSCFRC